MNIYCFSTLSFAKLQFKSVINKAFHKHGVASFTDAWIETALGLTNEQMAESHLLQMRGLKLSRSRLRDWKTMSHLLQMRGLKHCNMSTVSLVRKSHLLQMRGLKQKKYPPKHFQRKSHLLQMRGLKLASSQKRVI